MSTGIVSNKAGMYIQKLRTGAALNVNPDDVAIFTQAVVDAFTYSADGEREYSAAELTTLEAWMTGVLDQATWEHIPLIDAERSDDVEKISTDDRGTGGIKTYIPGDRDQNISFQIWAKKDAATNAFPNWYTKLEDWITWGTPFACLMLDAKRTLVNARGVVGIYNVFSLSESQKLNDGIQRSVEFAPTGCLSANPITRQIYRV